MCVLGAEEDEKLHYSGFMGHKLVLDLSQWLHNTMVHQPS